MGYSINQMQQLLYQNVDSVYDIFKESFGEKYVDLQKPGIQNEIRQFLIDEGILSSHVSLNDFDKSYETLGDGILARLKEHFGDLRPAIYVWWPRVVVSNEYNQSIAIQDLYAKIEVTIGGLIPFEYIGFKLNRATYSEDQFRSNYMHSHIGKIPKHDFREFMSPCLGRGPIRNTILSLKMEFDEALWMLFCQELGMYVTVESIKGGPWHRLEGVGSYRRLSNYGSFDFRQADISPFINVFTLEDLQNFIGYYLQKGHLSISYKEGHFCPGMPYHDYIIDLSNAFIDFFNQHFNSYPHMDMLCFSRGLLKHAILHNGNFYSDDFDTEVPLDEYRNKYMLTFKDRDIHISILKEPQDRINCKITIIDHFLAMYIMKKILRTINFRYKNGHNNQDTGDHESSSSRQRVIYL